VVETDTYGGRFMEFQKFSMGLLDFNNQLEVLVPKPKKAL
jgi:hypothetical protein